MSQVGSMDQLLSLRAPVTSKSTTGEDVTTWPDTGDQVWAAYAPASAKEREFYAAGKKQAGDLARFVIWRRDDVDAGWQLVWNGWIYNIQRISPLDKARSEVIAERGLLP